ncbi:frizzled-4-like [Dendronephthya gigantea]|uniref:frizzled-4-like n=1 Tax=Dendronephthya gigantea TaxID=151771 RepID=UPI00106ACFF7|nr:frizzled-4-like [Dendronephthya gigantea]
MMDITKDPIEDIVEGLPNMFGDKTQNDVERRLVDLNVLLTSTCADPIRFFLCSLYAPMCSTKTGSLIMSCGSLCEYVTQRCKPTAVKFNIPWLDAWNCSQFHWQNNKDKMCMQGPNYNYTSFNPTRTTSTVNPELDKMSFKNSRNYLYLKRTKSWVLLCNKDGIYDSDTKDFADLWMTIWSIVCFVSTSVAIITFLLDTRGFQYPERAIVMLALCYNLYSIGLILRVIFGRSAVSCTSDDNTELYITQNEFGKPLCSFVFLFLYFFGMAANIWWVILTLSWFLGAGMKWSCEAIDSYTNLFHLVAWLLPVIKTALVLIFRKIDGDELTGLCYVGNQDLLALTGFVLGPQFTYLIIGSLFLLAGFIALYRVRLAVHKERLHKIDKLDRFIIRIGLFSMFSTVPATCTIAAQFYEYSYREDWLYGRSTPNTKVLMLKICMTLFVGVISGAWIWTSKACITLKSFYVNKFRKQSAVKNNSNNNVALRNHRTLQADTEV